MPWSRTTTGNDETRFQFNVLPNGEIPLRMQKSTSSFADKTERGREREGERERERERVRERERST